MVRGWVVVAGADIPRILTLLKQDNKINV